jgi:hypothetical protein
MRDVCESLHGVDTSYRPHLLENTAELDDVSDRTCIYLINPLLSAPPSHSLTHS